MTRRAGGMLPGEVRDLVQQYLPERMHRRPGAVLYSGTDAIRPGAAYLMGFNPGGDPSVGDWKPLVDTIPEHSTWSAYTHECWRCAQGSACRHENPGTPVAESVLVRHQRNVMKVTNAIGARPEDVVSVNAVFGRSVCVATLEADTGISLDDWWDACWRVHLELLAMVRPRVIVSLGYGLRGSALGLLRKRLAGSEIRSVTENGRRCGRVFAGTLDLPDGSKLATHVVGVPHPSWREIGPGMDAELRSLVA